MVFFLLFSGFLLIIFAFLRSTPMPFLSMNLVFVIIYVWSRKDALLNVEFYGFRFSAWHMPFLYLLVMIIFGGDLIGLLASLLIGHLYHFLIDIAPKVYAINLLNTPTPLYHFMERGTIQLSSNPAWMRGQGHRVG